MKSSRRPLRVYIIADRGASGTNGRIQYALQRTKEPQEFPRGEGVCPGAGMNSGPVKGFIRVDIAHPGQEGLVEQKRFYFPVPGPGPADEIARRDIQGFRTEAAQGFEISCGPRPFHGHPPELPLVHEVQLGGA